MTFAELPVDTTFRHAYECEQLTEGPGRASSSPHYYYPGASTEGGRDGIFVEVHPEDGEPWLGTFAFGQIAPKGPSGIFTMPDPRLLCIVAKGEGYLVSANSPTSWDRVRVTPIIDVRPIRAHEIIVFAEFTRLVAYGQAGIKWQTKRLSWDNLKITEVTDTAIKGEFWDIRSEAKENFVVDLATGTHQGGIEEF
jgi:hypothetical protein